MPPSFSLLFELGCLNAHSGLLTCSTIESGLELWLSGGLSAFAFPSVVIETMVQEIKVLPAGVGRWRVVGAGVLRAARGNSLCRRAGLSCDLAGETLRAGWD
jgi:hypothetical protein